MKQNRLFRFSILALSLMLSSFAYSQELASWQFSLPEPSDGKAKTAKATTTADNIEISTLVRGSGAQKVAGNARGFSANMVACATYEDAKASGAYFQFVLKTKKGYKMSLRTLSSIMRRQEAAANKYRWTYSFNGKDFVDIDNIISFDTTENNGERQPKIDLKKYPELQNIAANSTVTFRIYAWGGTTNTGKNINFGFGKSGKKGNPVLGVFGTVEKAD